jgi:Ca2+-transporting ATPase
MPKSAPKASFFTGLSQGIARKRHQTYGDNAIVGKPPPNDWDFFIAQFKNPLVIVLIAAATITFLLHETTDTLVIGLAIAINTLLGFFQERKAFKSLEALKQVITPKAWVIRNSLRQEIDARHIVPGDLVELYPGDKVPADGVIIQSHGLLVNEAILTGESTSVTKQTISLAQTSYKAQSLGSIGYEALGPFRR